MVDVFFQAKVMHKRLTPKVNFFVYNTMYIYFSLFNKPSHKLLSFNKFNIFSFHNKDHAHRTKSSNTITWAIDLLTKFGIEKSQIHDIKLLTHPRCLGFVFNPVSFYFCLNSHNKPTAMIAEVNNTFGQTHSYIILEDGIQPLQNGKIYKAQKEFFVSPFFQTEGHYEFRINFLENKVAIFLNYFKNNTLALETSLTGGTKPIKNHQLLFLVLTSFKTVVLVNYQAFILFFIKRIKFRIPPKTHTFNITKND